MRKLATAAAVSLALASGGAFGLGLGEIEMQSALNQPMNAEIRLISVKPGELDGMIVQLASPEAFARAGIERSRALTGLTFRVDESSGTPVIKIESNGPVVEPFLNFLLEVDWPQGRMVREYTVLLDPPVFLSSSATERNAAADQPALIQGSDETALVVPTPIEREGSAAALGLTEEFSSTDLQDANTEEILSLDEATSDNLSLSDSSLLSGGSGVSDSSGGTIALTDLGLPNTDADAQRQADAIAAFDLNDIVVQSAGSIEEVSDNVVIGEDGQLRIDALSDDEGFVVSLDDIEEPAQRITSTTPGLNEEVTVSNGDTLFEIASEAAPTGVSVQQMMLAILAANESSFINNNINLVRAGSILRIPETSEATRLTQEQALASISDQNQLWQDYRDSLRDSASSQVVQNTTREPVIVDTPTTTTDTSGAIVEAIESAALGTSTDGLSSEAREILENARQEILDGEELRIVADNSPSSTAASATADETSETNEAARIGAVNQRLQLAREELAASRLRTTDLSEQADQLENTTENLEAMVSLRQNEVARLESQLAEARLAAEAEAGAANTVSDTAESVADAATDNAADAVNNAANAVTAAADNAADVADNAAAAADNAADAARAAADDAANTIADVTDDVTDDVTTGVSTAAEQAAGTAANAIDNAADEVALTAPGVDGLGDETKTWYQGFLDDPKRMAIAGIGGLGLLGVLGTLLFRRRRGSDDPEAVAIAETLRNTPSAPDTNTVGKLKINETPVAVNTETVTSGIGAAGSAAGAAGVASVAAVAATAGYVGSSTSPAHTESVDYLDKTFAGDADGTNDSTLSFGAADASGMFGDDDEESLDKDDTISEVDVYLAYGLHGQAEELLTKAIERSPSNPVYLGKLLQTYHAQGNSEAFRATAADYHVQFGGDDNREWAAVAAMGAELDPNEPLYAAAGGADQGYGSGHSDIAALSAEDFKPNNPFAEDESVSRNVIPKVDAGGFTDDETALMDASLDPAFAFDEGDLEATGDFSSVTEEIAAEDSMANDEGAVNFSGSAANESLKGAAVGMAAAAVGSMAGSQMDETPGSTDDLTLDLDQLSGDLELDSSELLNADLADLDLPDLTADSELILDSTGQFGTGADEMDTMLDLARAYIDMGDKESASSALGEIVKSGNADQINEAENLLRNIS